MTQGTPGFNGNRLREAREGRGLTQAALARLLEVSRQAISSYEKCAITPAPSITREAAHILGVTPAFFRRERELGAPLPLQSPTYFRSMARTRQGDRNQGRFRMDLVADLIALSMEIVEYPNLNLPELEVGANPELFDDQFIEHVADKLRTYWGLGRAPIENVVWLLENHGFVVVCDEVATSDIDAFSAWRYDVPVIMLSTNKGSAVRSRWDAAHELGHLVLHKNIDGARLYSKESLKLLEKQANYFAGALLLPRDGYTHSIVVPSLDEFAQVKPMWRVSVQAQIERCFNLGEIGDVTRRRLWQQIRTRGWSTREPFDDTLEVEQPVLLRKAIEIALADGDFDEQTIEAQVGIPAHDVFRLLALGPDMKQLQPEPSKIVRFPQRGGRPSNTEEHRLS